MQIQNIVEETYDVLQTCNKDIYLICFLTNILFDFTELILIS